MKGVGITTLLYVEQLIRARRLGQSVESDIYTVTHNSKVNDQPGKFVNPAHGQLNRENVCICKRNAFLPFTMILLLL